MLDRWKAFFANRRVLFALLIFQTVLYWMAAIYLGSEAIPVVYQRF